MNIRKHIEAVFLSAVALGLAASYVTAAERPVEMAAATAPAIESTQIHIVIVKAARLAAR